MEYVIDKFGRKFKKETDWQPNGRWNQPVPNMRLFVRCQYSSFTYYAHSDENGEIIVDDEMKIPAHIIEGSKIFSYKLEEPKVTSWKYI